MDVVWKWLEVPLPFILDTAQQLWVGAVSVLGGLIPLLIILTLTLRTYRKKIKHSYVPAIKSEIQKIDAVSKLAQTKGEEAYKKYLETNNNDVAKKEYQRALALYKIERELYSQSLKKQVQLMRMLQFNFREWIVLRFAALYFDEFVPKPTGRAIEEVLGTYRRRIEEPDMDPYDHDLRFDNEPLASHKVGALWGEVYRAAPPDIKNILSEN
ncbi:MAG: hypothetical protein WD883_01990 [Candidatus Colwellbacteria bacterium]